MDGVAGQGESAGVYPFALAVEKNVAASLGGQILDSSAGGACGLIADEKDVVLGSFNAPPQMIDNSPAGAHTASGQDDRRALGIEKFQVVAVALHGVESVKIDGMIPPVLQPPGFLVPYSERRA